MIDVERLKALAALQPEDIRGSEENLKQKFLVPLLEALKHEKRYLDFERPVHGGRLDVFVTGLPKTAKWPWKPSDSVKIWTYILRKSPSTQLWKAYS